MTDVTFATGGSIFAFSPDARQARIGRPGEARIDGQLVCYYLCPRCSALARALVYLGDAALAQEIVTQPEDQTRRLGLLAVGASLALNGGHGHRGGRPPQADHLSLWKDPPAALARAGRAARSLNRSIAFVIRAPACTEPAAATAQETGCLRR